MKTIPSFKRAAFPVDSNSYTLFAKQREKALSNFGDNFRRSTPSALSAARLPIEALDVVSKNSALNSARVLGEDDFEWVALDLASNGTCESKASLAIIVGW
jgi:hypothetical protein